ncbi:hypothetical protein Tco_1034821, partial [Tanacetum coccineum]
MAAATDLDEIEEVNANYILMANLHQASTSGTQSDKAPVYDSDGSDEVHNYYNCYDTEKFNMFTQEEHYTELLKAIPEPHQVQQNDSNVISEVSSVEQDGGIVDQHPATVKETHAYFESLYNNLAIEVEKEAAKFVRDFKSLAKEDDDSLAKHKALELEIEHLLQSNYVIDTSNFQTELDECKYDKISYDKAYNDMQQKIKRLQAQLGDQKGKVSEQKDTTKGMSVNTQLYKQSILGKPTSSSGSKLYAVTPFPKSKGLLKINKTHALSKPVTSNSIPTLKESKVVKNDKVIAPRMFRINPFKPSREYKYVPNKVRASVRTNPITVSETHVITKKDVNSDSNGLSSIGVDNTAKTRRPQPRSNTKNDRVPSASKSS